MNLLSFFPPQASAAAAEVDHLYLFLLAVAGTTTVLIFLAIAIFAVRYRRRSADDPIPKAIHGSIPLEIAWSVIPFLIMLVMFVWGTRLYFANYIPPVGDTLDIYITGKQWMWKVQHPTGQREINELHVPTGRAVKLILASEDVIHSFYIPAFRLKHDVVPGSYQTYWFQATETGRYRLFCAEYCGTNHSDMTGWVTVMTPAEYQQWLSGNTGGSLAAQGEKLFQQYGCVVCHMSQQAARCPSLLNLYGNPVALENGTTVVADESYLRESILNPNAKIVKGYKSGVMPVFQGQIGEERLLQLIVYLKSLTPSSAIESAPATRSAK